MNRLIILIIFLTSALFVSAQNMEVAYKHLENERLTSAASAFHEMLRSEAGNPEAWYGLTKTYLLQKDPASASDTLQNAPSAIRSEPFFMIASGSILLHKGEKEKAGSLFQNAIDETRGKNAGVMAAIAESHILSENGDAGYAIEMLEKAIKRDKKEERYYILLGDAYRKMHNGSMAYEAYRKALAQNDKSAVAYHRIGQIFLTQKNTDVYLENFRKSLAADPSFAPALYSMYVYELSRNAEKAMAYYKKYSANADYSIQIQYDFTDLLYLNKNYQEAIGRANLVLESEGEKVQPRIYKLFGYSYAALKDTTRALDYMQKYFLHQPDSEYVAMDFITTSSLYSALGQDSLAAILVEKAIPYEKDESKRYEYYHRLADLAKQRNDFAAQSRWLQSYYTGNETVTNLDLFNWGLASYRSENYMMADSVFGIYTSKYPEQSFGYYWQAKSKALQDSAMEKGIAVPSYEKLVEVLQKDTTDANYQKWLIEAYGYLAAYEVNSQKNYKKGIGYFKNILAVDPGNDDAIKYIGILEENLKVADSNAEGGSN